MDHEANYKMEADKNTLRFIRDEISFSEWNRRHSELVKKYNDARLSQEQWASSVMDQRREMMFGQNDEAFPSQEEWSAWVD